MKNATIFLLFIWHFNLLNAQVVFEPFGVTTWQQGACGLFENDAPAVFNNPANLSIARNANAEVFHQQKFGIKEMGNSGIAVSIPNKWLDAGFGYSYFGFSLYNQQRFGAAVSKKLNKKISLGINLNYLYNQMPDYSFSSALLFALSGNVELNQNWGVAFLLNNPTQQNYKGVSQEKAPSFARIGLKYKINKQVVCLTETELQPGQEAIFRFGLKYNPFAIVELGAGIQLPIGIFSFGAGLTVSKIKVSMAATVHSYLGFYPQFGMNFPLQKAK